MADSELTSSSHLDLEEIGLFLAKLGVSSWKVLINNCLVDNLLDMTGKKITSLGLFMCLCTIFVYVLHLFERQKQR